MIDAVVFDYGGVVMHEDPADYDAIGAPLGFSTGVLWHAVHAIPEYAPSRTGALSAAQFEQAVRAHLYRIAAAAAADAAIEALHAYYRGLAPIRAPMRALLASLRGTLRLALLSNATRGSTLRLRERGLEAWFDPIVCSGDVGVAKPDAAAFHFVAQRLGLPLARCAFVDDVRANVEAARALGMPVLHYHMTRHDDLLQALRRWRGPGATDAAG